MKAPLQVVRRPNRLLAVEVDAFVLMVRVALHALDEDDALRIYWCVDDKPKRSRELQRLVNIRAHPAVEVEVNRYDDDWTELWWVRASGMAREVTSADERARALTALAAKYPPYAGHPPSGPVVAIQVDRVSWWAAGASRTELS